MAVKQYIGARYVPISMGNWSATKTYEPLSIVTDGTGNSWTSRKLVPAGTPLKEGEYWALTGIYSEQILQLSHRVTTVEENIEDINNTVTALSDSVDLLDSNVNSMAQKINHIGNRKFVCISDSYGMRNTPNWLTYFEQKYQAITKGISSIGFLTSSPQSNFLQTLESIAADMTPDERKEITDIVVGGGWNDARELTRGKTKNDLLLAIIAFCDRAAELFPNAFVSCAFLAWQTSYLTQNETTFADLIAAAYIYNNARYKNYSALPSAQYVMRNTYMMDYSYFHPNSSGGLEIFNMISGDLFGGAEFVYRFSIAQEQIGDVSGISGLAWVVGQTGGILKLATTAFTINRSGLGGVNKHVLFKLNKLHVGLTMQTNQTVLDQVYFKGTINGSAYNGLLYGILEYAAGDTTISVTILAPQGSPIQSISGIIKISSIYDSSAGI